MYVRGPAGGVLNVACLCLVWDPTVFGMEPACVLYGACPAFGIGPAELTLTRSNRLMRGA